LFWEYTMNNNSTFKRRLFVIASVFMVTTITNAANLRIQKQATDVIYHPFDYISYTIIYGNTGTNTSWLTISDTIPTGLDLISYQIPTGHTFFTGTNANGDLTLNRSGFDLTNNQSGSIVFTAQITNNFYNNNSPVLSGTAYHFDGIDNQVSTNNIITANQSHSISINLLPQSVIWTQFVFGASNNSGYVSAIIISGNQIGYFLDGTTDCFTGIQAGTGYIVVWTYNTTTQNKKFYINNELICNNNGTASSSTWLVSIWNNALSNQFFHGFAYDARIFSTELQSWQVSDIREHEIITGNLTSRYKMDEQNGLIAYDSRSTINGTIKGNVIHARNGTLYSFPTHLWYNSGSVYFSGTAEYIDAGQSTGYIFGTGPFTIDFWMRTPWNLDGTIAGNGFSLASGRKINIDTTNSITFERMTSNIEIKTNSNTNQRHHIAIVRQNTWISGLQTYFNGVNLYSGTYNIKSACPLNLHIWHDPIHVGTDFFHWHIKNFRISQNIARRTWNFTPPKDYTGIQDSNTTLLIKSTATDSSIYWQQLTGHGTNYTIHTRDEANPNYDIFGNPLSHIGNLYNYPLLKNQISIYWSGTNTGTASTYNDFQSDLTSPTIRHISPTNNSNFNTGNITLVGSGNDDTSGIKDIYFNIYQSGTNWISIYSGTLVWTSFTLAFPDQDYLRTLQSEDNVWNLSSQTTGRKLTVDTTPPTLSHISPASGSIFSGTSVPISRSTGSDLHGISGYIYEIYQLSGAIQVPYQSGFTTQTGITLSWLQTKTYIRKIKAQDTFGNRSNLTTWRTFQANNYTDLWIQKTISGQYYSGGTVTYTIRYWNSGTISQNATITDNISPSRLSGTNYSSTRIYNSTWEFETGFSIAPATSGTLTLKAIITTWVTGLTGYNTISISPNNKDINMANNTNSVTFITQSTASTTLLSPSSGAFLTGTNILLSRTWASTYGVSGYFYDIFRSTNSWRLNILSGSRTGTETQLNSPQNTTYLRKIKTQDNTSNWSEFASRTFTVDNLAPQTTPSDTDTNWRTNDVHISLSCQDNSGVGCNQSFYKILNWDSACTYTSTTGYSTNIDIVWTTNTQSIKTLCYYSTDLLGNKETIQKQIYKIDKRVASSSHGGWGGGWAKVDDCDLRWGKLLPWANTNGIDYSPSYYDRTCEWPGSPPAHWTASIACDISDSMYPEELEKAYLYACQNGITSMDDIFSAGLDWPLIRAHMAKMISIFATKYFDRPINKGKTACASFEDIETESRELQQYIKISCQLGLMGLEYDGVTPQKNFAPTTIVSRAQFGTILSRLIRKTKYDGNPRFRYRDHLIWLQKAGIMKNISAPLNPEMRWRVMLMLQRVYETGLSAYN